MTNPALNLNKNAASNHSNSQKEGDENEDVLPLMSDGGGLEELGNRIRSGSFSRKKKLEEDEKAEVR